MTTAILHGWDFVLKEDLVVIWDGIYSTEAHHVKILSGQNGENHLSVAETATGNGTIGFNLNGFIETDPDHYCLFLGPANHFVQGAKPMSALIRTDWYHHNLLQFCWLMTTPNKEVIFKKGTPIMTLINYPKNLLESTDFYIKEATHEQKQKIELYINDRNKFYSENPGLKFANLYKQGVDNLSEDSNRYIDNIYKPRPTRPIHE